MQGGFDSDNTLKQMKAFDIYGFIVIAFKKSLHVCSDGIWHHRHICGEGNQPRHIILMFCYIP